MKNYKYMITYQYFTYFFGIEKCHFDFVRGVTIEAAEAALSERMRKIPNLQALFLSEVLDYEVDERNL